VTSASNVSPMIASFDDSTSAASRAMVSTAFFRSVMSVHTPKASSGWPAASIRTRFLSSTQR
jgi:hypothetical protein